MAAIMGYRSRTASVGMVNALARKGYLQNNYENRRGIRLSDRYAVVVIDMEATDE
jgi:Mn-dependent DtxR family transcriptional regulator